LYLQLLIFLTLLRLVLKVRMIDSFLRRYTFLRVDFEHFLQQIQDYLINGSILLALEAKGASSVLTEHFTIGFAFENTLSE
jgi:hypothetical protein